MAKLIATVGLPGSGKSTWAADQAAGIIVRGQPICPERVGKWVVVEKDKIREELEKTGWKWSQKNENDVIYMRDRLIHEALEAKKTVVSSDTNLAPKHLEKFKCIAKQFGVHFEVKTFWDVPLDECIRRDSLRTGKAKVGEKVIREMHDRYLVKDGKCPCCTFQESPLPIEQDLPHAVQKDES